MIAQVDNSSIFVGWFVGKIIVHLLLRILLMRLDWIPDLRFGVRYPKLAWLPGFYTFSQIILVAFSIIFVGRSLQSATSTAFIVFIIFVPLISVDVLQAVIEIIFSVSSYSVARIPFAKGSSRQYYFAHDEGCVRLAGFVRLTINIVVLMAMIYVFL